MEADQPQRLQKLLASCGIASRRIVEQMITAKRIKVSKTGKLIHKKAGHNHLLVRKWDNLRADGSGKSIHASDYKKIKALLPYSA